MTRFPPAPARRHLGFTMVELMVALALGLALTYAMSGVYLSTKGAFRRMEQLSGLQQSVRTAFEYLAGDARMVGHQGCFTRRDLGFTALSSPDVTNHYAVGIEGYDWTNTTAGAYSLDALSPDNSTDATQWAANAGGAGGISPMPLSTIDAAGLAPGSDVLVLRSVVGKPVRLKNDTVGGASTMTVESIAGGTCSDGTTAKVSGLCAGSHALVASCISARVFTVASVAGSPNATVTLDGNLGSDPPYTTTEGEVFPLQTVVYYLKKSSSGTTTSLYRRIFDGNRAGGLEQELIEGVENLQVTYGVDTTAPPDGIIDSYVAAPGVASWNSVVAVRMSLLIRSAAPLPPDIAAAPTGVVNGVTVTYPDSAARYDRRVFTTTVAVRNRIAYF